MLSHHAVFNVPFAAGCINYSPSGKAEPKISAVPPIDRTYVHGASRLLKIIFLI